MRIEHLNGREEVKLQTRGDMRRYTLHTSKHPFIDCFYFQDPQMEKDTPKLCFVDAQFSQQSKNKLSFQIYSTSSLLCFENFHNFSTEFKVFFSSPTQPWCNRLNEGN
jgi:hypothetical protein